MKRRTFFKYAVVFSVSTLLPIPFIKKIYGDYNKKVKYENLDVIVSGIDMNPADALVHVLKTVIPAVPDSGIDLVSIKKWHGYCKINNLKFNKIVEPYSTTAWVLISDICIAGKASVALMDGKFTIVQNGHVPFKKWV